jgi:ribonucleoside-diphosphate reductase alpha chain
MTLFALAVSLLRQETIDAVDFAELFAFTTNLVEQGGSRRGALMLVYNVDGEVIEKFVTRKRESGRLVGANVSVGVTDAFMTKVKRHIADKANERYNEFVTTADNYEAHRIWSLIVESARNSAEPGVLFLDRYNGESNSWYYAEIEATNPCGEQGLPANAACNLGHLVLPRFVNGDWTNPDHSIDAFFDGETTSIDYASLERAVRLGVRFQDDMIDYSLYPTEATKAQQMRERRIGMGTMGLGTLSIMLGLRYGSDEHLDFIDDIYARIAYWAYDESMNLAAEKGAFPAFDYEKYRQSGFVKRLLSKFPELDEKLRKNGIRNVTLLTQAPTGRVLPRRTAMCG